MAQQSNTFNYNACIVRPVSSALQKALRMEEPDHPIDIAKAQEQHKKYVKTLKELLPNVFEVSKSQWFVQM
jgi:N-dimethylarginine dimethylaminohydrolase